MATTQTDAALVAELNDLLQLDHDAVQAYSLAIKGIRNPEHRETLTRFRGDHERHVRELTELIREHDGIPVQLSHIPTGPMKLAVQAIGNAGRGSSASAAAARRPGCRCCSARAPSRIA